MPSAIRFNLTGKPGRWVSGKDVILHIIGMIGVDGALYKSMEFGGEGLGNLSMDDRLTIANMAIEAGAKNGIFEVDEVTLAYEKGRVNRPFDVYAPDPTRSTTQSTTSTSPRSDRPSPSRTCPRTPGRSTRWGT